MENITVDAAFKHTEGKRHAVAGGTDYVGLLQIPIEYTGASLSSFCIGFRSECIALKTTFIQINNGI